MAEVVDAMMGPYCECEVRGRRVALTGGSRRGWSGPVRWARSDYGDPSSVTDGGLDGRSSHSMGPAVAPLRPPTSGGDVSWALHQ